MFNEEKQNELKRMSERVKREKWIEHEEERVEGIK